MDESTRYSRRSELLQEAEKIITQDRNKTYGDPDEDFQRIAAIASAMGFRTLKTIERPDGNTSKFVPLDGSDVARFMIALKLSRLSWMPTHRDSWLDIAGYAGCGYETAYLEQERSPQAKTTPLGYMEIFPELELLANKAVMGEPELLEDAGFFLHILKSTGCEDCNGGHQYADECQYRIRKRRTNG
jgi:uncharacterized protein DUF6378